MSAFHLAGIGAGALFSVAVTQLLFLCDAYGVPRTPLFYLLVIVVAGAVTFSAIYICVYLHDKYTWWAFKRAAYKEDKAAGWLD